MKRTNEIGAVIPLIETLPDMAGRTITASLAAALWRGFRHREWSAFRGYELPDDDEGLDMDTRTGGYSYLRDWEERNLHDDGQLR